jgi:hypothetical protein
LLSKTRLADGGMEATNGLFGPGVFLDVWAIRQLSSDAASDLRRRFSTALLARNGSLLVSSVWVAELDTIRGDARTRAQAFFSAVGANWLLLNPVISIVAMRQATDALGASLSQPALNGYVIERCGELLRAGTDPHTISDSAFFDLGRVLAWESGTDPLQSAPADRAESLRAVAMTRASADRDEQRRDRSSADRLYPPIDFISNRVWSVHNAIWREVTRQSLGRTWMPNDGFDVAHIVPAMAVGGYLAVDTAWRDIASRATADLPPEHVRLYRPGELELLVQDLETC